MNKDNGVLFKNQQSGLLLSILLVIVVTIVRGIGQSVDWVDSIVIGQDLFGDQVILVGVMVGVVGVASVFVGGVERGGGRGVVFSGALNGVVDGALFSLS